PRAIGGIRLVLGRTWLVHVFSILSHGGFVSGTLPCLIKRIAIPVPRRNAHQGHSTESGRLLRPASYIRSRSAGPLALPATCTALRGPKHQLSVGPRRTYVSL